MIKTILGAAILIATLSTGAQALTIGTTVTTDAQVPKMNDKMMMDKHHHKNMNINMTRCKHFMHRAHGKCVSTMKMHKMKHQMMPKY